MQHVTLSLVYRVRLPVMLDTLQATEYVVTSFLVSPSVKPCRAAFLYHAPSASFSELIPSSDGV